MSIVEMRVPTIGESITEVTLSQWLKKDGEWVDLDEPICEFESDKATLEFPAEGSGILKHVAHEGDDLEIGALVAKIDTSASKPTNGQSAKEEAKAKAEAQEEAEEETKKASQKAKETPGTSSSAVASPAAAKILSEGNIAVEDVNGSGKGGRITKEDALKAVASEADKPTAPAVKPEQEKAQATQTHRASQAHWKCTELEE